jgi:hypothetical protein
MKFTYTITQTDNTFTWTNSGILGEAANATIDGATVKASWKRGMSGDGSATGKVVTDAGGRAIRIEWSNGVHLVRQ